MVRATFVVVFVLFVFSIFGSYVEGGSYERIVVNHGEYRHFYNENITVSKDISNDGVITFDNCTIECDSFNNTKGDAYFNFSTISNCREFISQRSTESQGRLLINNCIFENIDEMEINNNKQYRPGGTLYAHNSTFRNIGTIRGQNLEFFDCYFENCTFEDEAKLYNTVTVETFLDEKLAEYEYNITEEFYSTTYFPHI